MSIFIRKLLMALFMSPVIATTTTTYLGIVNESRVNLTIVEAIND